MLVHEITAPSPAPSIGVDNFFDTSMGARKDLTWKEKEDIFWSGKKALLRKLKKLLREDLIGLGPKCDFDELLWQGRLRFRYSTRGEEYEFLHRVATSIIPALKKHHPEIYLMIGVRMLYLTRMTLSQTQMSLTTGQTIIARLAHISYLFGYNEEMFAEILQVTDSTLSRLAESGKFLPKKCSVL